MNIGDKEYQILVSENQVLKNMIKSLKTFDDSSSMDYESYYKTISSIISHNYSDVVNNKLIDMDIINKTLESKKVIDKRIDDGLG